MDTIRKKENRSKPARSKNTMEKDRVKRNEEDKLHGENRRRLLKTETSEGV